MIHDRPARIDLLALAGPVSEVACQMLLRHALVGAQRDDHHHLLRSSGEGLLRGAQQQRQRAGSGAVGNHQAHAFPVQVGGAERLPDKPCDFFGIQQLTDAADRSGTTRVTRVCAVGVRCGGSGGSWSYRYCATHPIV